MLFVSVAWMTLNEADIAHADGGMGSSAYFSNHDEKFVATDMLMGTSDARASLGIGISCLPELWKKEGASSYDDSFTAFMASRKDVCIPNYSDPVVWEDNPRYTMQDNGCGNIARRARKRDERRRSRRFRSYIR